MKNLSLKRSRMFTTLGSLIFAMSLSAQTDGIILGSIEIGNKEFSSVYDETTGCVHRTSLHSKGLFKQHDYVKIEPSEEFNRSIIYKGGEKEIIFIETSDCNNRSSRNEEKFEKDYEAPVSPFPECRKDENPIGGGAGYYNKVGAKHADIHITSFTSAADFKNTIENAPAGSVIFIDGNLTIDLTGLYIIGTAGVVPHPGSILIKEGITLASDRGVGQGALIKTSDWDPYNATTYKGSQLFIIGGENVRITGIRFEGPSGETGDDPSDFDLNNEESKQEYLHQVKYKSCINVASFYENSNFEADNCEFYNWPYNAINVGGKLGSSGIFDHNIGANGSYEDNRIHHNYFHTNRQNSLGYGIQVNKGFVKIASNTFQRNRHDIAGSGVKMCGYEASCNTILSGGTGHNFDMHAEGSDDSTPNAGHFIHIHHNDFQDVGLNRYQSGNEINIFMRGRPDVQCKIENNKFAHDGPQAAIKQSNNHGGYGNMLIWNNVYYHHFYLGWYVKENWLKTNASNFMNLPSSNDWFMDKFAANLNAIHFDIDLSNQYIYGYNFGDFNGDGETDVFKLENNVLYTIPLNSGYNDNWQYVNYITYPMSQLRFGFYDSDNKTDIIVQEVNNINASFGCTSNWTNILTTSYSLSNLKSGDFDGNGITDLMLADGVSWLVSYNSNSSWQYLNSSQSSPFHLALGWFDGNNKSDVFMADGSVFKVSYDGLNSWTNINSTSYHTSSLIVEDFNGDNISDVIRPNDRYVSITGSGLSWQNCKTTIFPLVTFPYGNF